MRPIFLFSLALFATSSAAQAATCASLASLSLPDTTINHADPFSGGTLTPPYGAPIPTLPPFCRVTGILHPTSDSVIRFEVWLPEKAAPKAAARPAAKPTPAWNHRLLDVGNGGFAGTIAYGQMAANLRKGYATAGTDAGHQAEAEDASWAYHHPEKIADFGYRALHLTTERAKSILAAYYGEPQKKAYFDACSDGGREALMEAQRFPNDYDGILAGAPANDWTNLVSAGVDISHTVVAHPDGYIPSLKLRAINAAVLNACDAKGPTDTLKDGILNDPRACHFDPATLLCKAGDELTCLTAPQVASLTKLYSGGHDSTGKPIFPGLMPGGEADWRDWITGPGPSESRYLLNFFRYMVYDDPAWSPLNADTDTAVRTAHDKMAESLNATNPDLTPFVAHGGKLLLYHGWSDPAISPLNTIAYYQQVVEKLGPTQAASAVKLYMVPGMGHCAGGPGPTSFGQLTIPTLPGQGALDALEDWVENAKTPTTLTAAKFGPDKKPVMTRSLCPYPQLAQYKGTGNPAEAASFTCATPPQ